MEPLPSATATPRQSALRTDTLLVRRILRCGRGEFVYNCVENSTTMRGTIPLLAIVRRRVLEGCQPAMQADGVSYVAKCLRKKEECLRYYTSLRRYLNGVFSPFLLLFHVKPYFKREFFLKNFAKFANINGAVAVGNGDTPPFGHPSGSLHITMRQRGICI